MANARIGNSIYIDSTGTVTGSTEKNVLVSYVIVTATAASAILKLEDPSITVNNIKLDLRVATSGATQVFDFSTTPVVFPNGVAVDTITNATAMVVLKSAGG